MGKLFKYSFRMSHSQHLPALLVTIIANVVLAAMSISGVWGNTGKLVATSISGLILTGLFVISVLSINKTIQSLFKSPSSYLYALAPVPSWKTLLSHIAAICVYDILFLAVGIIGTVVQGLIFADVFIGSYANYAHSDWPVAVLFLLMFVLTFLYTLVAIFFIAVLSRSVYYNMPFKKTLSFLTGILAVYLMSFADIVLMPFGRMFHWRMFYSIQISLFSVGTVVWMLLLAAKITALFCATAHLMERRINL